MFASIEKLLKVLLGKNPKILNDDQTLKNPSAQDLYNNFRVLFPNAYCEISAGGHGLHIIIKVTDGKFTPIKSKAFDFDTNNSSKVEVFFGFNETITLTTRSKPKLNKKLAYK